MKKLICVLLVIGILFSIAGCGASNAIARPDDAAVKKDVQAYITEAVDPDGSIDIFEITNTTESGSTLTIECSATFTGASGTQKGAFTLTYTQNDGVWTLENCGADLSAADDATPQTEETGAPTETGTAVTELSDDWTDFTFELSGVLYRLPVRYETFAANGWNIDATYGDLTEETEIPANTKVLAYLTDGAVRFSVYFINLSGNVRAAGDCDVGGIIIEASSDPGLKLAKGITNLSTMEEVLAAYGTPESASTYDDYKALTYFSDDNNCMRLCIYKEKTTYNSIELRNYVASERDETEINDERPAYLDTYKAPDVLSSDVKAPQFLLDNVIYQLPCPLDTFTDNGWEIKSDYVGSLGAGNKDVGISLQKGELQLYVGVMNFAKTAQYSKNCAVYYVEFEEKYFPDDTYLVLPSGLTVSSTAEEADAVFADFEKNASSNSTSYYYYNSDYVAVIKFCISKYGNSYCVQNPSWDD